MTTFATAIGECGIAWSGRGVHGVTLPEDSVAATLARLRRQHSEAVASPPDADVAPTIERIVSLLEGSPDDLADIAVAGDAVPDFARRVYDATRRVTPGRTTTYGAIATQLGAPNAAREVGQALGLNPVPIIVPCHRVLGAGGRMVGFSAPGGVETKLRMLAIEGAAAPDGQTVMF